MLSSSRAVTFGLELVFTARLVGCTPNARESSSSGGPSDAASQAVSPESSAQTSPQRDPDHLGIVPEVLVSLAGGGQVYGHLATDKWFYLAGVLGVVAGGTGIFRMPKEPGVIPELISEEWSGSTIANFHFDGQFVYFLDDKKLSRWKEDLSDWTTIELEKTHFHLRGDADSIFAIGDRCEHLTVFDKVDLSSRTYVPEGAQAGGGSFGVTSDGERLYCTGLGMLYTLDKTTGSFSTKTVTWGDPKLAASHSPPQFLSFFYEDGRLNVNSKGSDYWGYVDVETGVFDPVNQGGWNGINFQLDAATGYVYFVENHLNAFVWRYDRRNETGIRLSRQKLMISSSMAMDANYVYFVTRDDPIRMAEPIGIMRVRKPSAD